MFYEIEINTDLMVGILPGVDYIKDTDNKVEDIWIINKDGKEILDEAGIEYKLLSDNLELTLTKY